MRLPDSLTETFFNRLRARDLAQAGRHLHQLVKDITTFAALSEFTKSLGRDSHLPFAA